MYKTILYKHNVYKYTHIGRKIKWNIASIEINKTSPSLYNFFFLVNKL